ncbi:MAG: HAMP domain-containing protein [Chloroflexota bacterium]|nr:HAMP domain-containing protein [Chloroflexota bacterium]
MSLRLKLTLTYSLLVAGILAALGITLYVTMQQTLFAEMDQRLRVRSDEVQYALWPGANNPTLADLTPDKLDLSPLADIDAPELFVQVVGLDGTVLGTSSTLKGRDLPVDQASFASAAHAVPAFADIDIPGHRGVRVLSAPVFVKGKVAAVLQVSQSRASLKDTLNGLRDLLLLLGIVALLVSAFVGWFVAHRGLRPLSTISREAVDIAKRRDFSRRLKLKSGRDEVSQLAATIDHLLATVDETLRSHRDFVADTSHELRNPLLAIQTNLDVIDRVADAEARAECLREAKNQLGRMSRLVSDLLLLAQVERGLVIELRPVDMRQLLQSVADEARRRANGQTIELSAAEPAEILGDAERLRQILSNLIDNAFKHTPANGSIRLGLVRRADVVEVTVEDTGQGIAPEDLPYIFDRGYRVNPSESGPGANYGLGLTIVRHLTAAHGGRVTVQSELGRGSCFTVTLPRKGGVAASATMGAGLGISSVRQPAASLVDYAG